MNRFQDYFITLLAQLGGGPGPPENNLVRFGVAATLWGVLLIYAWTRQHNADRPRERWLLWGFGFAFLRDSFMFAHLSLRMINQTDHDILCTITVPLEHSLTLLSVVMISGAFLRYILDDPRLARRNLKYGLGLTALAVGTALVWWPQQLAANPEIRFHATWSAWLMHTVACVLIGAAIVALAKARGWVSHVVLVALSLLFISEFLVLVNLLTARAYSAILCPLGNTLYISSIPVFGFVYLREQAHEKQLAEVKLRAYRDHLEELVDARTVELTEAHAQTAAMQERQRIAAEMHDGLAQTLSYLGLKTDQAENYLANGQIDAAVTQLDNMHDALRHATVDVRRTIYSLQQHTPLQRSLQEELQRFAARPRPPDSAQIDLQIAMRESDLLPADVIEQMARIVQEAVANADRHAKADSIWIRITPWGSGIEITVTDDGIGFDSDGHGEEIEASEHFGLSIMQARAAQIGAALAIESAPGHGTTVRLCWRQAEWNRDGIRPYPDTPVLASAVPEVVK